MAKLKGRAKQFANLEEPLSKGVLELLHYLYSFEIGLLTRADFDPEADIPAQDGEGSDSEASDDDLAGTEHYGDIR
jgi:protein AATF/BFR2